MIKQAGKFIFLTLMLSVFAGCVAYGRAYVQPAPPPDEVEVIGIAPFPQAVWVPGYWQWHKRHREYRWVHGYWGGAEHRHR